ncbi:MAG: hypothetical protein NTX57_00850 [Armatimonadetes bacterium]|nr:hypothetical protein [Armatimonadota bacterium]
MSIPDRIGRLGKAYVGVIKDKIDSELGEREAALSELDSSPGDRVPASASGRRVPPPPQSELSDVDSLMRRAEEKIASARRELESRQELTPPAATVSAPVSLPVDTNPLAADYRVLNLSPGASLGEVQAAYEDLLRRSDPKRFPEGSNEQAQARRILERVNLAYENLRRENNPTEDRFAKLEL